MQGLENIGTEVCWLVGESLQTQLQQQISSACIIAYWSAGLATATGILSTTLYYIWQSLGCRTLINFHYPIISHVKGDGAAAAGAAMAAPLFGPIFFFQPAGNSRVCLPFRGTLYYDSSFKLLQPW